MVEGGREDERWEGEEKVRDGKESEGVKKRGCKKGRREIGEKR